MTARPSSKKMIFVLFLKDHGQTKPKPKPRGAKKLQKLTGVEQEGESRCLFRATNGKKKLSTIVSEIIFSERNLCF